MSIGNLSKRKGGFGAGYLYNFKGSVNSPAGLPAAPDYGDIYKIISTDKMVIWDGNAWSDLSNGTRMLVNFMVYLLIVADRMDKV